MHKKHGFTLIELSIVLVIIGLLIGGILVAQSMIESSKLQAFIKQVNQLDIAVSNFKTRFNQLPGDSNLFTYNGNNDGLIKDYYNNDDYLQGEIGAAWSHLSEAGVLQDNYTRISSTSTVVEYGVHVPEIEYGEKQAGIVIGTPLNASDPHYNTPVFWISHFPEIANNWTWGGACVGCGYVFTTTQALAADKKMDDGLPRDGDVRAAGVSEFASAGSSCINSGTYYINSPTPLSCNLIIKLLTRVGER